MIQICRRYFARQRSTCLLGLGVEIDGVSPITDINVAVTRMLERINKKHKRVLVTIDEAVCNDTMKEFVSLFQIYMRQDLPVFLLMTGLYENIYELQNEKNSDVFIQST